MLPTTGFGALYVQRSIAEEDLIELDGVHRDVLNQVEGGIAAPEVVHSATETGRMNGVDDLAELVHVLEHHVFRELDFNVLRRRAAPLADFDVALQEKGIFELHAGAVHRYFYRGQPASSHARMRRQTSSNTQRSSWMMNPFFSNSEMNSSG